MRTSPFIDALFLFVAALHVWSHSGRTDAQGGHRDRKRGGYHFHHGMGPHDHPGGVCEYRIRAQQIDGSQRGFFREKVVPLALVGAVGYLGYANFKRRTR